MDDSANEMTYLVLVWPLPETAMRAFVVPTVPCCPEMRAVCCNPIKPFYLLSDKSISTPGVRPTVSPHPGEILILWSQQTL